MAKCKQNISTAEKTNHGNKQTSNGSSATSCISSESTRRIFEKMRYIDTGMQFVPKHCIYGPRPAEGLVLNGYEWWSITDSLVRDQRKREMAAITKAKEEAKKNLSYEMTSTWSNTMASIKIQSKQKRLEKLEREKQEKIDMYHEILKNKKEEKRKLLESLKTVLFMDKDAAKTINSAVWYSTALDEVIRQREKKRHAGEQEAKLDREFALKFQKDVEELHREEFMEKLNEKAKKKIYRQVLEAQMADNRKKKLAEAEEFEREKQDQLNMRIEEEKIRECEMKEKEFRRNFAAKYIEKPEAQLEYERSVPLENEEEDEINKIFWDFECRIKRKRKEREEKLKKEETERREKITEMIVQKMQEKQKQEDAYLLGAEREKEEQIKREMEERKEKDRLALEYILEGKRQALEWRAKKEYETKERKKWELMQQYRSMEVNEEWRAENKRQRREEHQKLVKVLECQRKENEERKKQERKEMLEPLEDPNLEQEELLKFCENAMNFIKENNLPERPVRVAIRQMKKLYGIIDEEEQKLEQERKLKEAEQQKKKARPLERGCYCLKY